jgi:hypothetical protein
MAIKTFTAGEVLTAADTNTYLANSGLVYVKQQTVGNSVSSVEVTAAFSSTYDNYEIIYTGGAPSTDQNLRLQFGSTTTGYYGGLIYLVASVGTVAGLGFNNDSNFPYLGDSTTAGGCRLSCKVYAPNLATRTGITSQYMGTGTAGGAFGTVNGNLDNNTQYTSFTISPNTGTITGGIIFVYGYRKA